MNKKTKAIIIGTFAAVVVIIGTTTAVLINQPQNTTNNNQQAPAVNQETNNEGIVSFTAEANLSVLDQLKSKNSSVETNSSSLGEYVNSINGVVSGTDGKYWSYYVDGQMAQVGAGEYITKGGELVEWKFE